MKRAKPVFDAIQTREKIKSTNHAKWIDPHNANYTKILEAVGQKRYRTPKGFNSYNDFISYVARFVYNTCKQMNEWNHEEVINKLPFYYDLSSNDGLCESSADLLLLQYGAFYKPPVFVINNELLNSFYYTSPLTNWSLKNLFSNSGLILFPLENIFNLQYLLFSRFATTKNPDQPLPVINGYAMFANGSYQSIILPMCNESEENKAKPPYELTPLGNPSLPSLLLSIFLYESLKPSGYDVAINSHVKKMGFGTQSKNILTPKIIGENYTQKRVYSHDSAGSHKSPCTHWRSGHWRQQAIGNRKKPEHKTIWIEPTLVNA